MHDAGSLASRSGLVSTLQCLLRGLELPLGVDGWRLGVCTRGMQTRRRAKTPEGQGSREGGVCPGADGQRLCFLALCLFVGTASAQGEPVDLLDPTPRPVLVQFEISPHDEPGRLDSHYTTYLPARLGPGSEPETVEIRVAGYLVEQHVLVYPTPVDGSFSDFVWLFDAKTGAVIRASVSGEVETTLGFGIAKASARARIVAEMDTAREAGFEAPRRFFGKTHFRLCAQGAERACTWVAPRTYADGYVNAVGELRVRTSLGIELESFSPLGEARFSEVEVGAVALD